ncbi:MAG: hypothetical protein JWN24_2071 [Phycisphaerales bacterium]|nr:hypothetical protein [Phycisphaerales bacterium]
MLEWVYYILLAAVLIAGLYINLVGAPGLWLMALGTIIYGLVTHWKYVGWKSVVAVLVIAGLAELAEFVVAGAHAKRAGASRRGLIGAIVGGIVGAIFFTALIPVPVLGTIFGVCLGTFLGAILGEVIGGTQVGSSLRVGVGAAKGRLLGILTKLLFGCILLGTALWTALPPIHFWHRGKAGSAPAVAAPAGATTAPAR